MSSLPSPPPAVACSLLPVLLREDAAFAALIAATQERAPPRVEVRIQQKLSAEHLDQPVQFGLFATATFKKALHSRSVEAC